MATAVDTQPSGLAAISRAVVAAAAELAASVERAVVGDQRVRTARGNAYEAICADRARARARDEMDALVRGLLAEGSPAAARPATPPVPALQAQVPSLPRRRPESPARPRSERSRRAVQPRHRAAAPRPELVSAGIPEF